MQYVNSVSYFVSVLHVVETGLAVQCLWFGPLGLAARWAGVFAIALFIQVTYVCLPVSPAVVGVTEAYICDFRFWVCYCLPAG